MTSDSEIDEIMDDAVDALTMISSKRYSFRSNVPKNLSWFDETVPQYDEKRFKMMFRCTRQQFQTILDLIKDNPVFHGKNSEKQFSSYFQLALVMYRLGSFGTGAEIGKIAALFGIGDGGTIDKITWRVFKCILQLENEYMNWPSAEERMDIILENCDELPHCIGFADGIEFKVLDKPADDHVSLYSRKKQYSIKMQGTCDFKEMLRHVVIGWPGSVHDARIFSESRMSTHPDEFFSGMEYLGADSAYTLTERVITPFRSNSSSLTPVQRAKFNKYFSSKRVRIEHVFGILKQIFCSLMCLGTHVSNSSYEFVCIWIRVCCILYNILRPQLDEEDVQAYLQPNLNNVDNENEAGLLVEPNDVAEAKRIALYDVIFNENV